ncbi:hypothetical protein [Thermocrinis sp.]
MKKLAVSLILLASFSFASSFQENPFLVPERANVRINVVSNIAKQLKERGFNSIAVVYMNTSDLCALTSASLVASLKTLGVDAYYLKGGDPDLPLKIKNLGAKWVYLTYFGEMPYEEVQRALNQDLRILSGSLERANLIVHPSILALGFFSGALVDEDVYRFLQRSDIRGFLLEKGIPKMVRVYVKDLEVNIEEEPKPPARAPEKKKRR